MKQWFFKTTKLNEVVHAPQAYQARLQSVVFVRCKKRICLQYPGIHGASAGSNEDTLGSRVVKNMVSPIKGRGHHVYIDNFFTSVSLAKDLLDDNTFMIGTARSGRKGWPQVLKELKALKKALKKALRRGESKSVTVEDGKVECLVWKDNTVVPLVNTISKPQEMTHVKTNKDGSKIDVSCPESIKSYNKFTGGVDLFDSRRETYSCSMRWKKW